MKNPLNVMLIALPIALYFEFSGGHHYGLIFVFSSIAMIPLASILGHATEEVAAYTGPRIGGLLNATLGNAAELIITVVALNKGLTAVVKASIAGSILGNILVVLGASLLLGGIKNGTQFFDSKVAGLNASILMLAIVALMVPAIFSLPVEGMRVTPDELQFLSAGVAVTMIVMYVLYILYLLKGTGDVSSGGDTHHTASMPLSRAIIILVVATVGIVVMSETLVGAIEPTTEAWGLSPVFVGVMLIPLIGNVAEHLVAVKVAMENKMDLSLGIALGSGLQIALFVAPLLVIISEVLGKEMNLVFNPYEVIALFGAGLIAVFVSSDGESNWLEGAQLISLYVIMGIAFYFV